METDNNKSCRLGEQNVLLMPTPFASFLHIMSKVGNNTKMVLFRYFTDVFLVLLKLRRCSIEEAGVARNVRGASISLLGGTSHISYRTSLLNQVMSSDRRSNLSGKEIPNIGAKVC